MSTRYDPSAPFPPPGSHGEYGRAWLDSLYWNDREQYEALERAGRLQELASEMEAEGRRQYRELMTSGWALNLMKGRDPRTTPDEQLALIQQSAREVVMAGLRTEYPPDEVGDASE